MASVALTASVSVGDDDRALYNERGVWFWNRRKTGREGRSGGSGAQGFRRGRGAGGQLETQCQSQGRLTRFVGARPTYAILPSARWEVRGTSGQGIHLGWVVGCVTPVPEAPLRFFQCRRSGLLFQFPRIAPFGPRLRRTRRARPRAGVQSPTPSASGSPAPPPYLSVRWGTGRPRVGCGSTT